MSRIDQLDPAIKAELDRLLRSGVSQAEILRRLERPLADAGEKPLSAAGLNRYATRMEAIGRKVRESRQVAEMWVARIGQEPTSDAGQLIIEILRTLVFDITLQATEDRVDDDGDPLPPIDAQTVSQLALSVQRLERAAEWSRQREAKLRAAVAAEAEQEARRAGLPEESAAKIREALVGRRAA